MLGVIEFRRTWTTHISDDCINAYDRGREIAHRLTLRRWEDES
jgi:hypothetical protein